MATQLERRDRPTVRGRKPTLLVVDDEPDVLNSLFDLFRLDYRVLSSGRGDEALGLLEQEDVSVIMSDQRMPEMSGVEFLSRARTIQPDSTRLLMTGYADLKAVIDAINRGHVFRYIAKPWDPDELGTVLRQAVDHYNLIIDNRRLIVELKAANAQLQEANRLKEHFIEVASHELNTPVTIVLGMAELWKLTEAANASETTKGWVDRILSAGRRLSATVERMFKLLRNDTLAPSLDVQDQELEPLLRRAVAQLMPYIEARSQHLDVEIASELGSAVVDADKIVDACANLLINAVKFTPDGGSIRLVGRSEGNDCVVVEVLDEGIGIDPQEHHLVFEPFFTGFDTMHHSSGDFQFGKRGIGLGLSLVKSFVELHGGHVTVKSSPGQGSTFGMHIPRQPRTPLGQANKTSSSQESCS